MSILRWSPEIFWRATPRELIAAWEGLSGGRMIESALSSDLERLMESFPDSETIKDKETD
ncbi:phage tail assembly chaperone [Microvirga sp. BT689]|uniref:phage tail assembly chaperone n=1 Tax=Microvirga arvi TaxID=2778731 RepID=UPI00194FA6B6|nr:phage tail assembly chaperone [Microvirga arvi]MBM6581383.1 phage tail assembly chaperone [Microvirga arvi]